MDKLVMLKSAQMQELESKKAEFEIEKIKAEVDAKALQERANEDITIRKLQVRHVANRYEMICNLQRVGADAIQIGHHANGRRRESCFRANIQHYPAVFVATSANSSSFWRSGWHSLGIQLVLPVYCCVAVNNSDKAGPTCPCTRDLILSINPARVS
jgi:hypothetical protein